jgi:hypothetical protein
VSAASPASVTAINRIDPLCGAAIFAAMAGSSCARQPISAAIPANQAWFEYLPARVTPPSGSLEQFGPSAVKNVKVERFDENGLGVEPNNLIAIAATRSSRCLARPRAGRHRCMMEAALVPFRVKADTESPSLPLPGFRIWPAMLAMRVRTAWRQARSGMTMSAARWAVAWFASAAACQPALAAPPRGPRIVTEDVTRFYRLYDATGEHPTAEQLEHSYLDQGSDGLRQFAKLRRVSGATIRDAIEKRPEIYADARRCLAALPAVKRRLIAAFSKLAQAYPEANFAAPVIIVVGRGKPVGMTDPAGVAIGLEALCAANVMDPDIEDRFVHTIAHEYGHIQQPRADQTDVPGATVLFASLIEGGAEFTAELISGDVANYQLKAATRGREATIETAFVADVDKTDLSAWLYNEPGTPERPGDLGYWVGHRIVTSYYQHAPDKHQALRDIFEMKDPKAFLARSGWSPAGSRATHAAEPATTERHP